MMWRIMHFEEDVIHRGLQLRWITSPSICIFLHILLSHIQELLIIVIIKGNYFTRSIIWIELFVKLNTSLIANRLTSFSVSSGNVTCYSLTINQCADAGYNLTSVSSAYQKILENSDVFNNSKVNSTLRKIICMEVAPPCNKKYNNTLLVPCKTTCETAFNESKPQFEKIFKSSNYCSAFLKTNNVGGQDYCVLQEWPNTGYWPSDLWKRVSTGKFMTLYDTLKQPYFLYFSLNILLRKGCKHL